MEVPDNQKIAIFWNDKPIGLVEGKLTKPKNLGGDIVILSWHGEFLGKQINEQSPNEVYKEARRIAKEKGLRHIWLDNGKKVETLYSPAFEE